MNQDSLFAQNLQTPLASRLRPTCLEEYIGQKHLLKEGGLLRTMIEQDHIPSLILWGPPGVGKTTLARIIANHTHAKFIDFSAVTSGMKEIKEVMKTAEQRFLYGEKTIVFVDEIHRFNKAQQDAFLPYVEKGCITLVGATTENPSFEINAALLSRCKVFVLYALTNEEIVCLLEQALHSEKGFLSMNIQITQNDLYAIALASGGDARTALNILEMAVMNARNENDTWYIDQHLIEQCTSRKALLYDKQGEEHYNIISALHKSMRNSDVDASIYWLARMLEAGEDPLYVARRLVRFASEDIGMADPKALDLCLNVYQACHYLGMPECSVHLTHAVTYLSLSVKSNSLYVAYERAKQDALRYMNEPVPLHLRNAPTKLMKDLHYGEGYQYAHDTKEKITTMRCLPDCLMDRHYYEPSDQGVEARAKKRFEAIQEWKKQHS